MALSHRKYIPPKPLLSLAVKFWIVIFLCVAGRVVAQAGDSLQCLRHTHYYDGEGPWVLVRDGAPLAEERDTLSDATPVFYDGKLYVSLKHTGLREWSGRTYALKGEIKCSPAISGDLIIGGNTAGQIVAFSRAKGSVRWKYKITGSLKSPPIVAAGMVFIGSAGGTLYALDTNGKLKWSKTLGAEVFSPSYDNGVVYAGTSASKGVACIASDGKVIWETTTGGRCPVVLDSIILLQNGNGALIAVNKGNGAERWRFDEDVSASAFAPAASNDYIVLACGTTLSAISPATGKRLWYAYLPQPFCGSPMIVGRTIYQPCTDFNLHILEASSGHERATAYIGFAPWGAPVYDAGTIVYQNRNTIYRYRSKEKE